MNNRKKMAPEFEVATISIGGLQLPQKVYPLRRFEKTILLLSMLFAFPLSAAFLVQGLIPDGMAVLINVSFVAVGGGSIVVLGYVYFRAWNQRLEFSADGITLIYFFYRIYAPWSNIAGYDNAAQHPLRSRRRHPFYGGFVYKEPVLLYASLRKDKEEQRTVVQIPRLRARTNPELVAYLSHYLPLLPEMFPEKELSLFMPEKQKTERW